MRLFLLTLLCSGFLLQSACAQARDRSPPAVPPGPPRLVVAISVDQFSADLFAQYRRDFTQGLARLQQGAVYPSAYQAHAATETCPGHATMLTGVHPSRSGIIANTWFDPKGPRADKRIYCAEDERDQASSPFDPVVSAVHLKVPTLGERLKAANPASRNVAVSGKDRAAMMMAGRNVDAAYWWKGGGFVTFPGKEPDEAVDRVNRAVGSMIARGVGPLPLPDACEARDQPVTVGSAVIGQNRFALPDGNADAFRGSPRLDLATADLAIGLVDEMDLGKGLAPDLLSVSFSATDYVGHAWGTEGVEMCLALDAVDRAIGKLLDHLDRRRIDYVVMLTADHGGIDAPERLREQGLPRAERVDPALSPGALGAAVSARTGIRPVAGPLIYGDGAGGDHYLSAALTPAERTRVLAALVTLVRGHPQVAAAYTAKELASTPVPAGTPQDWNLRDRARASFDPQRSGDLVVMLDRAVVAVPSAREGLVSTHGSPWDYDRRVPLLFWRRGMAGYEQPAPVDTVDIAPSLAALLGLDVADGAFDGRCLDLDGGAGNTCDVPDESQ